MPEATDLTTFLRSRRAALTPEQIGMATYGQRRVPGLRREELAEVAGVSLTYYTRLEQGHAPNVSTAVLDAIARALRLSTVERTHLFELARPTELPVAPSSDGQHARPGVLRLLDAMSDVPAILMGRNQDILAWNRLGHALTAPHLDVAAPCDATSRPNKLQLIFTDPTSRTFYREWEHEARLAVASLRYLAAQFPDDRALAAIIGELSMASSDFAALWADHPVELCASGTKRYQHPDVGRIDLQFEVLHPPENDGQRILVHTAEPGSPHEDSLRLLASQTLTAD
ncbi:helix-turn-helix domain-containing protein [Epidermidibacterium keratini]|uniref:Helix-turn-helix domain-containing protein n=1 Tax=Epidermidibacterium keratini TaxID=1891644 RepID=A0A7L4YM63_9ACTN|nr:helix-turn-helix transcriptional regulator [Epidermidibacterium keratini]QHC00168.1 helix-turn-helix domain-containing protein [Epidermidibacterium keratini]